MSSQPPNSPPTPEHITFSEAERNAMRAYLQRSEVRISTLHRIATAFVGGAGLLILIPVFFKDIIAGILEVIVQSLENQFPHQDPNVGIVLTLVLYALVMYPLILSLAIPVYSLYLLLKDIIHFYFSIYAPGFPATLLHPSFSLGGILFSKDESPSVKKAVMHYEYSRNMDYMLPFSEGKRELYFDHLIETTNGDIIPESRKWDKLLADGMIPPDVKRIDVERFDAALGVVRSLDRNLVEEVATTEMLLARNVMYLRRLVLRYAKSLLMFVWTFLISFLMLPFLKDNRFPLFLVLGMGYFVWSLFVVRLIRTPITWIYQHRLEKIHYEQIDKQLTTLEDRVIPYCRVSLWITVLALVIEVLALL
jgi:hypothetical protein